MSDDFTALFGGELDADEVCPPAPPASEARIATIVAQVEQRFLMNLPDGQRINVQRGPFDRLESGAVVPVFPDGDGGWSVIDPAWTLTTDGKRAVSRGFKVNFTVSEYDAATEALIGVAGAYQAFAPRERLPWPAPFRGLDLQPLVKQTLRMAVVDPLGPLLELGQSIKGLPPWLSLFKLYSLRTLARLSPLLRMRVASNGDNVHIDLFGKLYQVFPEDRSWHLSNPPPSLGQLVDVHLSVDMGTADIVLCLRCPHHPEWAEIRERYPVGTVIERASFQSLTHRGLVVLVPDPALRVVGILPLYHHVSYGRWREGDVPLPLRVAAHADDRCALVLDIEPYTAARWHDSPPVPGQWLALHATKWDRLEPLVLWDLGARATLTRPSGAMTEWGVVVETNPAERSVVLEPRGTIRMGQRLPNSDGRTVFFEDGSTAECVPGSPALPPDRGEFLTDLKQLCFGMNGGERGVSASDPRREELCSLLYHKHLAGELVRGRVIAQTSEGFRVDLLVSLQHPDQSVEEASVSVVTAFLPRREIDHRTVSRPEALIGGTFEFALVRVPRGPTDPVVVSHKAVLVAARAAAMQRIRVGEVLRGVVKRCTARAVFVDLGILEGLLHVNELPFPGAQTMPRYAVGQQIDTVVHALEPATERVCLAPAWPDATAWADARAQHPPGSVVSGIVDGLVDGGLAVTFGDNIPGLVESTRLTRHPRTRSDLQPLRADGKPWAIGDPILAVVVSTNDERRSFVLDACNMTERETASQGPSKALRTSTGQVVSLDVLGARYKIRRPDLLARFDQLFGRAAPAWSEPLALADAQRMIAALSEPTTTARDTREPSFPGLRRVLRDHGAWGIDAEEDAERTGELASGPQGPATVATPPVPSAASAVNPGLAPPAEPAAIRPLPAESVTMRPLSAESVAMRPPPMSTHAGIGEVVLTTWLHLSDIHFGQGTVGYQYDQKRVVTTLLRDVKEVLAAGRVPAPDLVFVTGDVACKGGALVEIDKATEYDLAEVWFTELLTGLRLTHERMFVVPGNHDINRRVDHDSDVWAYVDGARNNRERLRIDDILANDRSRERLLQRQANFQKFARKFGPPDREQFCGGLWWRHRIPLAEGVSLRVCGMNTALLCANDQDKGKLYVGGHQLNDLLLPPPDPLEIPVVLSHHPPLGDWLADQGMVSDWLDNVSGIHLFGHIHEHDSAQFVGGAWSRPCLRIAAGAVHTEESELGVPHSYSIGALVLRPSGELVARIWPRRWANKPPRFIPDGVKIVEAKGCSEHSLHRSVERSQASASIAPGAHLGGRYRVEAMLGHGAVGHVYRAIDTHMESRIVALKVLNPDGLPRAEPLREVFFQGARRRARMPPLPALVQVLDPNPDPKGPYDFYVMEFIDGSNLRDAFRGQPCTEARTIELLLTISGGLADAHRVGLIHRDLKPSNILLDRNGRIGIIDFDTVKDVRDTTTTRSERHLATHLYAAPEVNGQGTVDRRADVYSLAATGIYLLTGKNPSGEFINRMQACATRLTCSDGLRRVLARACSTEVQRRHPSVEDLMDALSGLPNRGLPHP